MEQTKIEVQDKDKTPDKEKGKEKPKQERTPLTEAERLRRQKMIVLPVMVLVFLGAMWLIFGPSSEGTKEPGMDGYNLEMPDADKADRQIIGDKAKAYEQGAMEERKKNRNRSMMELGDMFDREVAGNESSADFCLTDNDSVEKSKPLAPQSIRSSAGSLPLPRTHRLHPCAGSQCAARRGQPVRVGAGRPSAYGAGCGGRCH